MAAIDNFDELNGLVEKLIHLHKASKKKIEMLTAENKELREKITNRDTEQKQRTMSAAQMAESIKQEGGNTEAFKAQLASYIEAIDHCIKTIEG
jgi:hypothetical protein